MNEGEELPDRAVGLDSVSQRLLREDGVVIPPPLACASKISRCLKIGHDSLHRPLGDAHMHGHVPEFDLRISSDDDQDMRVIAQERPGVRLFSRLRHDW
jgi:hypothetical protein